MAHILVVDDDASTRVALQAILTPAGYAVIEAANGEEAIRRCREQQADLVVLDILMPEKEGLETIRELKRDFPKVKIIAISGCGAQYLRMAKEFSAHRTFRKPFSLDEIVEAVKALLEGCL